MMLHVQGVCVPFLPVPHHAFNLLVPVCAEYVIRLTSFIQYKAWMIKFTLLTVFPHSQQLLACAIIICLLAPCCLYFQKISTRWIV
jgi:hypothetical protein